MLPKIKKLMTRLFMSPNFPQGMPVSLIQSVRVCI